MVSSDKVKVRVANLDDLQSITEIYNEAIVTTDATFDTEPKTFSEQLEWFKKHGPNHPVLVAELDRSVVGWVSLSNWSDRCAYSETAEISIYVKEGFRGKGIGKKLMETVIHEGKKVGFHTVLARMTTGNSVSIHIHESFGFKRIGVLREVGRKFGRLLDVVVMQKIYE